MGKPISLNSKPHQRYVFDAPESLINGIRGIFVYGSGDWVGWFGEPMDVTIDMGGKTAYSSVAITSLVQKGEYIFAPLNLKALTSEDGSNFTEIACLNIPMENASDSDEIKEYSIQFPQTSARYLKVTAKTVDAIPDWHGARGENGFLFVDEIVVR